MGGASAHNASMHSASTKHWPAHPRNVDDVGERRPHDLGAERYREREFCLLKGIAEGTYNTKHAEAASYTTTHTYTYRALSSDTLMNVVAIPIEPPTELQGTRHSVAHATGGHHGSQQTYNRQVSC